MHAGTPFQLFQWEIPKMANLPKNLDFVDFPDKISQLTSENF